MKIWGVDYAPDELYDQLPLIINLIKKIPDVDGVDYWIGSIQKPILWIDNTTRRYITHVIVSARYVGAEIKVGINLVINIAYVLDESVLTDDVLDFQKGKFIAIGIADVGGYFSTILRKILLRIVRIYDLTKF